MQLQLHYTKYTTPQLQLHYTTTTTTAALHSTPHYIQQLWVRWPTRWPLQPLQPFPKKNTTPTYSNHRDGGHIRPSKRVTFAPKPKGVTFAPKPQYSQYVTQPFRVKPGDKGTFRGDWGTFRGDLGAYGALSLYSIIFNMLLNLLG